MSKKDRFKKRFSKIFSKSETSLKELEKQESNRSLNNLLEGDHSSKRRKKKDKEKQKRSRESLERSSEDLKQRVKSLENVGEKWPDLIETQGSQEEKSTTSSRKRYLSYSEADLGRSSLFRKFGSLLSVRGRKKKNSDSDISDSVAHVESSSSSGSYQLEQSAEPEEQRTKTSSNVNKNDKGNSKYNTYPHKRKSSEKEANTLENSSKFSKSREEIPDKLNPTRIAISTSFDALPLSESSSHTKAESNENATDTPKPDSSSSALGVPHTSDAATHPDIGDDPAVPLSTWAQSILDTYLHHGSPEPVSKSPNPAYAGAQHLLSEEDNSADKNTLFSNPAYNKEFQFQNTSLEEKTTTNTYATDTGAPFNEITPANKPRKTKYIITIALQKEEGGEIQCSTSTGENSTAGESHQVSIKSLDQSIHAKDRGIVGREVHQKQQTDNLNTKPDTKPVSPAPALTLTEESKTFSSECTDTPRGTGEIRPITKQVLTNTELKKYLQQSEELGTQKTEKQGLDADLAENVSESEDLTVHRCKISPVVKTELLSHSEEDYQSSTATLVEEHNKDQSNGMNINREGGMPSKYQSYLMNSKISGSSDRTSSTSRGTLGTSFTLKSNQLPSKADDVRHRIHKMSLVSEGQSSRTGNGERDTNDMNKKLGPHESYKYLSFLETLKSPTEKTPAESENSNKVGYSSLGEQKPAENRAIQNGTITNNLISTKIDARNERKDMASPASQSPIFYQLYSSGKNKSISADVTGDIQHCDPSSVPSNSIRTDPVIFLPQKDSTTPLPNLSTPSGRQQGSVIQEKVSIQPTPNSILKKTEELSLVGKASGNKTGEIATDPEECSASDLSEDESVKSEDEVDNLADMEGFVDTVRNLDCNIFVRHHRGQRPLRPTPPSMFSNLPPIEEDQMSYQGETSPDPCLKKEDEFMCSISTKEDENSNLNRLLTLVHNGPKETVKMNILTSSDNAKNVPSGKTEEVTNPNTSIKKDALNLKEFSKPLTPHNTELKTANKEIILPSEDLNRKPAGNIQDSSELNMKPVISTSISKEKELSSAESSRPLLPKDFGLKKTAEKDNLTPLQMMKMQTGEDRPKIGLQRATAEKSVVFQQGSRIGAPSRFSFPPTPQLQVSGAQSRDNNIDNSTFSSSKLTDIGPFKLPVKEMDKDLKKVPDALSKFVLPSLPSFKDKNLIAASSSTMVPKDPLLHTTATSGHDFHSLSQNGLNPAVAISGISNAASLMTPEIKGVAVPRQPILWSRQESITKEHGQIKPRPGKLYIYNSSDFRGERKEICTDVADSTSWDLPSLISILVVRGGWIIYEEPNFKGKKIALEEGAHVLHNSWSEEKENPEIDHNRPTKIGSLQRVVKDHTIPEISLFTETKGEGRKTVFCDPNEDTRMYGWPIKANSITVVSGTWLVYEKPFFEGAEFILEAGQYDTHEAWGGKEPYIGSLRPIEMGAPVVEKPREHLITIYEKTHFVGKNRDLRSETHVFERKHHVFSSAMTVGSIKVHSGCWVGYEKEGFRGHQYLLEEGDYEDCHAWGGVSADIKSLRPIRADFADPLIILFDEVNQLELAEALPDVALLEYSQTTKSINVQRGVWIAYENVNFSGAQYILEKGVYHNCHDWGASEDQISSLQPILQAGETPHNTSKIEMFSDPAFEGNCVSYDESRRCLPPSFRMHSCRVFGGSWILYESQDFGGNHYVLLEGEYPSLSAMGCPHNVSFQSIKPVSPVLSMPSISLYSLECFEGKEIEFTSDVSSLLAEGYNSHVLSLKVKGGIWVVYEHNNFRGRQWLLVGVEITNWQTFSGKQHIGSLLPLRQKKVYIHIKNKELGHFLAVMVDAEETKAVRVIVAERSEKTHCVWYYEDGVIRNAVAPNMSLTVIGSADSGSKVVLWPSTHLSHHLWKVSSGGQICNLNLDGMVLDVKGGTQYDKNHAIIIKADQEKPTQFWDIEFL
ncbi:beta/gamma crystallin domain-containing protein 2 [Protopterus annectens]|uniref:beta/gamma crystallin domain-containing protein 2 n=1 Tax=Protopterus annectens TaxID=7888 RepID=UPI001CFADCBC|nr:beta/gamma crystallin domain-containing protein 2 [Protopterus annectens]